MGGRSHIRTLSADTRPRPAAGRGRRPCRAGPGAGLGLLLGPPAAAAAPEPIRGEISVDTSKGYARIVFRFSDEIDADVRLANQVLVITFKTKVSVPVDRLSLNARGYVAAARSDPDGMAVRMAPARKVRITSRMAAQRPVLDQPPQSLTR